eukprot:gnl/TRDRNA2_/TRDRNA2_101410_c0_seq1.p1 gnl/TRDRNA2_/TRDRNA2_101410_c0~~gnl/TRDRNA2_/TRDRNA2_101410_c0_seq1.p1  ORF type:complete len:364 (-),score=23.91 gnl/TRDRNA2_/TRDRNA2_101410_c0_seq1:104-1195(-)
MVWTYTGEHGTCDAMVGLSAVLLLATGQSQETDLQAQSKRLAKTSCWKQAPFTWRTCCSRMFGPDGLASCWDTRVGYTFEFCCNFAPWNDHEQGIPLFDNIVVSLVLSQRFSHARFDIYQEGREDGSFSPVQYRWNFMSGFLWAGAYQMFRWFECFADQPLSFWLGRRYIEFGAGVGLTGAMAALNGAQVMLVDVDASPGGLIRDNIRSNLPSALWDNVRICQLNWSRPLNLSLRRLAHCDGSVFPHLRLYDIVACASSIYNLEQLAPLIHAVSSRDARFLVSGADERAYLEQYAPVMSPLFERTAVWFDDGLTAIETPLMEFKIRQGSGVVERGSSVPRTRACATYGNEHGPHDFYYNGNAG